MPALVMQFKCGTAYEQELGLFVYDARRAYGLSCSPRQVAVAWKRIDSLCSLLMGHNEA
ncbi:MAG: hypothetical protein V7L01_05225 [Nostoc sp.]|uniref:hypothetical protein n=1 Tax=Nostoc sp. TaxID=1180 RepID=UPI002FF47447